MMRAPPIVLVLLLVSAAPTTRPAETVRCAVIGGMADTGLWDAIAERFHAETGDSIEVVASGPKDGIDAVFRTGKVDLITIHGSDTAVNLVADGWAMEMTPWARNDMVIVGPPDDPAGAARSDGDAVTALKSIIKAQSPFVAHSSLGAQEVLRDVMNAGGELEFDPANLTVLFDDRQRRVLRVAAEKKAYTLCGRIPFLSGKIPNDGMKVVCKGDPRLRRAFVVAIADPMRVPTARVEAARRLSVFLRSRQTQAFLAEFGRGKYDDQPLFFPVGVQPATQP
jgi:tungstate transport system substrate-binding protein